MIFRPLDAVTAADLQNLIDAARPEGVQIEYKRQLPGNADGERKEFLADFSSFANKTGGDLIYGMDEARNDAGAATGIPNAIAPIPAGIADAEIRRLDAMVRDGLAPRISGYRIRAIPVAGGVVLVARIERSFAGPHQVTFQNSGRFYSRNNAGKYLMDVGEIGRAFRSLGELPQALKTRHRDRVRAIVEGDVPLRLKPGGKIVMHLIAVSAFAEGINLDLAEFAAQLDSLRPLYTPHIYGDRFNLDGLLVNGVRHQDDAHSAYLQTYRDGVIETVQSGLIDRNGDPSPYLPIVTIEQALIDATRRYLRAFRALNVGLPISLHVSMSGVTGKEIPLGAYPLEGRPPIDRDLLVLPHVLITDDGLDAVQILRPIFDVLWQSAGYDRCLHYAEDGAYRPRV